MEQITSMTEEQTNNARMLLIFLGLEKNAHRDVYVDAKGRETPIQTARFDLDWNLLMKVVEKIESTYIYGAERKEIAWRVTIVGSYCQIEYKVTSQHGYTRMFEAETTIKHQSVLAVVIAFVKWYDNGGKRAWG